MADSSLEIVSRPLELSLTDFQRQFMYLPLHIFTHWTNIADIVKQKYKNEKNANPRKKTIEKLITDAHTNLHNNDWADMGWNDLKFISNEPQDVAASIFTFKKADKANRKSTDFEKQFLYLPLSILKATTNIDQVMKKARQKLLPHKTDEYVPHMIKNTHQQLCDLGVWKGTFLHELQFNKSVPPNHSTDVSDSSRSHYSISSDENGSTSRRRQELRGATQTNLFQKEEPPKKRSRAECEAAVRPTLQLSQEEPMENNNEIVELLDSQSTDDQLPYSQFYPSKEKSMTKTNAKAAPTNTSSKSLGDRFTVNPKPSSAKKNSMPSNKKSMTKTDAKAAPANTSSKSLGDIFTAKPKPSSAKKNSMPSNKESMTKTDAKAAPANTSSKSSGNGLTTSKMSSESSTSNISVVTMVNRFTIKEKPSITKSDPKPSTSTSGNSSTPTTPIQTVRKVRPHISDRPSDFQREITKLNFNEFVIKTNIKDLIEKEHQEEGSNKAISADQMKQRLEFYYDFRLNWDEYHKNWMKNLKYSQCECKLKSNCVETGVQCDLIRTENLERAVNSINSEIRPNNISTESKTKKSDAAPERSEFQKAMMKLTVDECVAKTNIKELVMKDIMKEKGPNDITEANIKVGIDYYFRKIPKTSKWQKCLLRDLKYKQCECHRQCEGHGSAEKETQTDLREIYVGMTADAAVQYTVDDFDPDGLIAAQLHVNSVEMQEGEEVAEEVASVDPLQHPSNDDTDLNAAQVISTQFNVSIIEDQIIHPANEVSLQNAMSPTASSQNAANETQDNQGKSTGESTHCSQILSASSNQETQFDESTGVLLEERQILVQGIAYPSHTDDEGIENHDGAASPPMISEPFITVKVEQNSFGADIFHFLNDSELQIVEIPPEQPIELIDTEDVLTSLTGTSGIDSSALNSPQLDTVSNAVTEIAPEMSREQLINCLEDTFERPSVEKTVMSVQIEENVPALRQVLQDIENTLEPTVPAQKKQTSSTCIRKKRKKAKSSHDDTLSNIQPPRYTYQPLQLVNKQTNPAIPANAAPSDQADGTQPSQHIEEYTSSEEVNESAEIEQSSASNSGTSSASDSAAKLLNQDNTLFLNVNTQPANNIDTSTSSQQPPMQTEQPVNIEATHLSVVNPGESAMPVQSVSNAEPLWENPSQCDKFEFLYYINIAEITAKLVLEAGEEKLNLDMHLIYQCNGGSRIVVSGQSPKRLLNLSDCEWDAVQQMLFTIRGFHCRLNDNSATAHQSVLHRLLYYLFKTTSNFSNVHVTYNEQDFETARIISKPYIAHRSDLTAALDSKILMKMEQKKNCNH